MNNTSSTKSLWLALCSLWMGQTLAVAQEEIDQGPLPYNFQTQTAGPSTYGSVQAGTPYMGNSSLSSSSFDLDDYVATGTAIAAWGPFRFYPQISDLFTYGSGLQALPGQNTTTAVNTVTPDMQVKIGNHWSLDYAPSFTVYSNPLFQNTINQRVVLRNSVMYGDWTLSLSQTYLDTSQPLVETGTQVDEVAYITALSAAWQMNDHLSLQLGVNQNFRTAQQYTDLHEWSMSDWLNYQFNRQFGAAIGVTGGYDELSVGSDMPFEEAQVRINFQPGTKLTLNVTAGIEDRQFVHPYAPSLMAPIFSAMARYAVREGTVVTVSGNRTVTPSFFGNEVNVITSVTAGVRQHIAGKTFLTVTGTYVSEPFTTVVPSQAPAFGFPTTTYLVETRSDTLTSVRISLSTVFRSHLTGSIFYVRSDNNSSQGEFSYSGNQVGVQMNYRY